MINMIAITSVELTEYDRSTKKLNLSKQPLFVESSDKVSMEDFLCKFFSVNDKLYIKCKWESRELTNSELVSLSPLWGGKRAVKA